MVLGQLINYCGERLKSYSIFINCKNIIFYAKLNSRKIYGFFFFLQIFQGFPAGSDGKESVCNAGDQDSIPQSGRFPEEGNGNTFQYSCLENSVDRGAWRATVHGVAKS